MKKIVVLLVLLCAGLFMLGCADNGEPDEQAGTQPVATEAATEPEQEPTTAPPPTEPPPTTEPPPPRAYEIVRRFVFDDPDDIGWYAANQIEDFRVEDGVLKLTSVGGDPFIVGNAPLDIAAAEIDIIRIRVLNMSSNDRCQFFFDTDLTPGLSEDRSFRETHWFIESAPDSGQWNEIVIETRWNDYWDGIIRTIRFDPIEDYGDVFIEYISFERIVS